MFVQYGPTRDKSFAEETDYNCYGVIRIRKAEPAGLQLLAFQHELGHAFGLSHNEDRTSIMYAHAHAGMSITDEDARLAADELASKR